MSKSGEQVFTFAGFLAIIGVLGGSSIIALNFQRQFLALEVQRSQHEHLLHLYEEIYSQLKDVETGRRGYVMSRDLGFLDPYERALPVIEAKLEELRRLGQADETLPGILNELEPRVRTRIELATRSISEMRTNGYDEAVQTAMSLEGKRAMDDARELLDSEVAQEYKALAAFKEAMERKATHAMVALFGCSIISLVLVIAVFVALTNQVKRRAALERAHRRVNEQLRESVERLERQGMEVSLLAELSDLLQAALSLEEAFALAQKYLPKLFPSSSGALYFTSPSRDLVERLAYWGDENHSAVAWEPSECWALRRGRSHSYVQGEATLRCTHTPEEAVNSSICVPMVSQGEAQGILYVAYQGNTIADDKTKNFVQACAEQVSLGMTNLKLRDTLRIQATRDPLTGLYNRRFMQETLDREILRCRREEQPVGVILTDIDHFKQFNDTYGHAAGDLVIRELARFLNQYARGSDIPCRYGGEEFTLIFPGASKEITQERAEGICRDVRKLVLQYEGLDLGAITLSLGVAAFPLDAKTSTELLKAADMALYRAKANGRDQVVLAAKNEDSKPQRTVTVL